MSLKRPLYFFFFVMAPLLGFSQAPGAFKYQAVIREPSGTAVANANITVQIRILQGSISGNPVYAELHNATTNALGLINLEIGKGESAGSLDTISWQKAEHFIEVSVDLAGGSNFTTMGTSQLLSVPYALHANSSHISAHAIASDHALDAVHAQNADSASHSHHALTATTAETAELADTAHYASKSGDTLGEILERNGNGSNNAIVNIRQVGIGTATPHQTAALDVQSASQGFLPPRLTTAQRDAIANPAVGLMIFNVSTGKINYRGEDHWYELGANCTPQPSTADAGDSLNVTGTTVTLNANAPVFGTGMWTILSGTGGTLEDPNSPTSEFSGVLGNAYYLKWTITTECASSSETIKVTFTESGLSIGDSHLGGIIMHLNNSGGGLIYGGHVSVSSSWNCDQNVITGTAIGTGMANTDSVVAACPNSDFKYPAQSTQNGYSDWYVPSLEELRLIYQNLYSQGIGDTFYTNYGFWSSSQDSTNSANAYSIDFATGNEVSVPKSTNLYLLQIRSF